MEQHSVSSHKQRTQHLHYRKLPEHAIHHQPTHASAAALACQGIRLHHRSETLQLPRQLQSERSHSCGRPSHHISLSIHFGPTIAEAVPMAAIEFVFCRLRYHLRWGTISAGHSILLVDLFCQYSHQLTCSISAVDVS